MARKKWSDEDYDLAARTAWGEARGEGILGMLAVLFVIRNRTVDSRWPDAPREVVKQPWQFSIWNAGDPNREKVEAVSRNNPNFKAALAMAQIVLDSRDQQDPTKGANHYHAQGVTPKWAGSTAFTTKIGHHLFYKL